MLQPSAPKITANRHKANTLPLRLPNSSIMDSLYRELRIVFGQGEQPEERALVVWDGFDQPTKEDAVRFYSGKSWPDVLAHLRKLKDEPVFRGAYFLEEWSVLSPGALAYYARAHLDFLPETLAGTQRNEEFPFYFLGQLYQLFYMHKGTPFTSVQTSLLRRLVEWLAEMATTPGTFEYYAADIKLQAEKVLTEMRAHEA